MRDSDGLKTTTVQQWLRDNPDVATLHMGHDSGRELEGACSCGLNRTRVPAPQVFKSEATFLEVRVGGQIWRATSIEKDGARAKVKLVPDRVDPDSVLGVFIQAISNEAEAP